MISSCAGAGLSNVQGSVYHTGQMDMAGSYALQGLDAAALRCAVADPGCFVVQYAARCIYNRRLKGLEYSDARFGRAWANSLRRLAEPGPTS